MRIIGPDEMVFGVQNMDASRQFLTDYGLTEVDLGDGAFRFEALDGTAMTLRQSDDPALPPALPTATQLRQTVWGCTDQAAVDEIADNLSSDRKVERHPDGSITCQDDLGFELAFRVTTRRAIEVDQEKVNSACAAPQRAPNELGADRIVEAKPRTLSHIVFFVPDSAKMEAFYARLGFVVTDRFVDVGPFMRPMANDDHHCLFMLQTPPFMQGIEHIAFHMKGPTELVLAGHRLQMKGYETFWGPGRHNFGSNWFWYFNSPMGVHMEYDADMDKHDETWKPRIAEATAETSQMFLLEAVKLWFPNGEPPQA
ncbi:VOC family protein [Breoghania sp.]|uniref:VOC family protein n=1 Tax=Breoghania sp. TaxID=2065378 RepID=UPI002AA6AE8D|nr:VOC family protein [Breoghania sp.]